MFEPDAMHCANCGADVFSDDRVSYDVVRWDPTTQSNGFKLSWCPRCWVNVVIPNATKASR